MKKRCYTQVDAMRRWVAWESPGTGIVLLAPGPVCSARVLASMVKSPHRMFFQT